VIRNIVLPLDGSALAACAVPFAVHLARRTNADLVLLRATPHVNPVFVPHPEALAVAASHERAARREAAADLWELAQSLRDQELVAHVALAAGVPELAILDVVRTRPASLIVMATHGEGGLGRKIYGSVAVAVLRHTPRASAPGPCRLRASVAGSRPSACAGATRRVRACRNHSRHHRGVDRRAQQ
jgi:nucleotide-binding universal stress UspA family protein